MCSSADADLVTLLAASDPSSSFIALEIGPCQVTSFHRNTCEALGKDVSLEKKVNEVLPREYIYCCADEHSGGICSGVCNGVPWIADGEAVGAD